MGETTTCGDVLPLLPEDFFIQILVCLPVTSLLRFKSVCKSWRELIDSSFFINLHTGTTLNSSSKFGTFILQTKEPYIKLSVLSSGSGDGTGEDDQDEDDHDQKKMVFKMDDLDFLTFYKDYQLQSSLCMVGSCNGIICLHDPMLLDYDESCRELHYSHLRDVYLWNPATRQFRILPKSIPIEERKQAAAGWCDFVAFGFDIKTKDYKVLRITSTPFIPKSYNKGDGGCMCRVQVYSLSTDSWRLLEGIDSLPVVPTQDPFRNHGIYLNGSYYFVGTKFIHRESDSMLLSFDFTKEIFTTIQHPDDNHSRSVFSCLGDKMAVFTGPRIDYDCVYGSSEYYDIWVLNKQHGTIVVNKESWTKLHSFRIKASIGRPWCEPRCISNNGEFAIISSLSTRTIDVGGRYKLQLFNLITKEAKNDFAIGQGECRADVYQESLVSIMGGGNVLLRWQLPTHGTTYKLYLDAPFIDRYRRFGIGLCLTSDTGGCIGVRSLKRQVRDATEGEALAMLVAIKWAETLELSPITIESVSKKCVSFFMDDDDDDDDEDDNNSTYWSSEALSLLKKAKLLLNSSTELGSISFQYCSRSCNYVADIAAKLGREGFWPCKEWTANSPGEMVRSLSKDLGIETYGWGSLRKQ